MLHVWQRYNKLDDLPEIEEKKNVFNFAYGQFFYESTDQVPVPKLILTFPRNGLRIL